jgi:hypothetical protein
MIDTYHHTTKQLSSSGQAIVEKLNKSGDEITVKISESGKSAGKSYKMAAEKMEESLKSIQHSGDYSENMSKLNKHRFTQCVS